MDDDRSELVRKLFAVVSARLEDASELAAAGQDRVLASAERRVISSKLASIVSQIAALAEAVEVLAQEAD